MIDRRLDVSSTLPQVPSSTIRLSGLVERRPERAHRNSWQDCLRHVVKHNVTINNLLPALTPPIGSGRRLNHRHVDWQSIEEAEQVLLAQIPAGRFGLPD